MCAQILALNEQDATARRVVESLKAAGHSVVACDSFAEAIDILTRGHVIELIVSDVHLENGGNVFDFLRWVKKNPTSVGDTPFVMFSFEPSKLAKHLEDGVRTSARMLGASKYISMESFDSEDFRKQIEGLLPQSNPETPVVPEANGRII
jgi:CheY-like chemotaxis protein